MTRPVPFGLPAPPARLGFEAAPAALLTVGVEEEILLLKPHEVELAPAGPELVDSLAPDRRFTRELRASQVELVTPVCLTAPDIEREIAGARAALCQAAAGVARPVAVPVNPFSADPGPASDLDRHVTILAGAPFARRELLTCGMHVHIGIGGAERALAVHDALRSYLPLLGALAANSPFHAGVDARVASVRAQLKQSLPRYGVPPAFGTWNRYEEFLHWGACGGVIPDASYHWYDLRLNPRYATLEVRVFDVQTDVSHAAALVALTQSLVAWLLERHDAGLSLPVHASEEIAESLWLAARDGASGSLPDPDSGRLVPVGTMLESLLETLRPHAASLGCADHLDHLWDLERLPGHERQRLVERSNGIHGLVEWLAAETVGPGSRPLVRPDRASRATQAPADAIS